MTKERIDQLIKLFDSEDIEDIIKINEYHTHREIYGLTQGSVASIVSRHKKKNLIC